VICKATFQASSIYIQIKGSVLVFLCQIHQLQSLLHNLFSMIKYNMAEVLLLVSHQLKTLPGCPTHRNQTLKITKCYQITAMLLFKT